MAATSTSGSGRAAQWLQQRKTIQDLTPPPIQCHRASTKASLGLGTYKFQTIRYDGRIDGLSNLPDASGEVIAQPTVLRVVI